MRADPHCTAIPAGRPCGDSCPEFTLDQLIHFMGARWAVEEGSWTAKQESRLDD
ncbi:hypothetical protein ACFVGW_10500 [Streptomyces sp. NPDC127129]|uniref:hypothetical protein n=1 Tax=Streptomyces sp. NPDC127129 TaxID=3345373 RepID=UPI003638709B